MANTVNKFFITGMDRINPQQVSKLMLGFLIYLLLSEKELVTIRKNYIDSYFSFIFFKLF